MLFITLMTKMSDTAEAKYKYGKNSPKLSRAPQGRRLGDEHLEVLVVLVALSKLPRRKEITPLIKRRIWAAHNREHG